MKDTSFGFPEKHYGKQSTMEVTKLYVLFFISVKSRIYIKKRARSSQRVHKRSTKGDNTTTLTYAPTRLKNLPKNLNYQHYTI